MQPAEKNEQFILRLASLDRPERKSALLWKQKADEFDLIHAIP